MWSSWIWPAASQSEKARSCCGNAYSKMLEAGDRKFLLSLADVDYIDSSGLGELVSSFTTVKNQEGALKLLGLTRRVQDLMQITKLLTVFDVYDDEAEALKSFR